MKPIENHDRDLRKHVRLAPDAVAYLLMMAAVSAVAVYDISTSAKGKIKSLKLPQWEGGVDASFSGEVDSIQNFDKDTLENLPPDELADVEDVVSTLKNQGVQLQLSQPKKILTPLTSPLELNIPEDVRSKLDDFKQNFETDYAANDDIDFKKTIFDYFAVLNQLDDVAKEEKMKILDERKSLAEAHKGDVERMLFEIRKGVGRYVSDQDNPLNILSEDPQGNCVARSLYEVMMLSALGVDGNDIFVQKFNNSITPRGEVLNMGHVRTIFRSGEDFYTLEGKNGPRKIDVTQPGTMIFSQKKNFRNFLNREEPAFVNEKPDIYVKDRYGACDDSQEYCTSFYVTEERGDQMTQPVIEDYAGGSVEEKPKISIGGVNFPDDYQWMVQEYLSEQDAPGMRKAILDVDLQKNADQRNKLMQLRKTLDQALTAEAKLAVESEMLMMLFADQVKNVEFLDIANQLPEAYQKMLGDEFLDFEFSNEAIVELLKNPLFFKTMDRFKVYFDTLKMNAPSEKNINDLLKVSSSLRTPKITIENLADQAVITRIVDIMGPRGVDFVNPKVGSLYSIRTKFVGPRGVDFVNPKVGMNFSGLRSLFFNFEVKFYAEKVNSKSFTGISGRSNGIHEFLYLDRESQLVKKAESLEELINIQLPSGTTYFQGDNFLQGLSYIYDKTRVPSLIFRKEYLKLLSPSSKIYSVELFLAKSNETEVEDLDSQISALAKYCEVSFSFMEAVSSQNSVNFSEAESVSTQLQELSPRRQLHVQQVLKSVSLKLSEETIVIDRIRKQHKECGEEMVMLTGQLEAKKLQHFDIAAWKADLVKFFDKENFDDVIFILQGDKMSRAEFLQNAEEYFLKESAKHGSSSKISIYHSYIPKQNAVEVGFLFSDILENDE